MVKFIFSCGTEVAAASNFSLDLKSLADDSLALVLNVVI